jgi:rod shape determining protein RodA
MNWNHVRAILARMDWIMIFAVVALLVIGVMFIYSAGYRGEDAPVASFYERQMLWALVGGFFFISTAFMDYRRLRDAAWWLYFVAMLLLVLVLLVGKEMYGARRWLTLFGLQVQPSEFAKLAALVVVARFLGRPGRQLDDPVKIFQVLSIVGVPFLLIVKEPDLGTAAMLIPVAFMMMFAAGVPLKHMLILAGIGLLLMPFGWFLLGNYQKERVLVFLNPNRDPLGAGWNKIQSGIAVGSGGFSGKGYLKGTQNVLGFLPRTVAPTDFIYSVIAEETGFVGSAILLFLYALLLWSCVRAALVARDRFGRLLAVGVGSLLFCHAFVNMAMTIGLLPITGLPLPLISYGGSFMVAIMIGLGIVQSVYVRRYHE